LDVKLLISGLKQVEARLELSADQVKAMVYDELPANMQSDEQEREAKDQVVKHMNAVMSHLMKVHDLVVDVLDKGLSRGANASDIHNATYFAAQTIVLLGIREQDLIEYADADADT